MPDRAHERARRREDDRREVCDVLELRREALERVNRPAESCHPQDAQAVPATGITTLSAIVTSVELARHVETELLFSQQQRLEWNHVTGARSDGARCNGATLRWSMEQNLLKRDIVPDCEHYRQCAGTTIVHREKAQLQRREDQCVHKEDWNQNRRSKKEKTAVSKKKCNKPSNENRDLPCTGSRASIARDR